jgi:hypothetical protein
METFVIVLMIMGAVSLMMGFGLVLLIGILYAIINYLEKGK